MFWRIKDWYYSVRSWFRCNFNKRYFRVAKAVHSSRPWDYGYFQEIMMHWFEYQASYFEKSQIVVGWERMVKELRLAKSLLEIITEKRAIRTCKYFQGMPDVMLVNVNTKNAKRFMPNLPDSWDFDDPWAGPARQEALYIAKANKLFHRLLEERSRTWWD